MRILGGEKAGDIKTAVTICSAQIRLRELHDGTSARAAFPG